MPRTWTCPGFRASSLRVARRLENWIDSFVDYAQVYNTPERYRRWTAIWTIATTAKRSIAMQVRGNLLAPNIYAILVGGPATGKSQACTASQSVLMKAGNFSLIPPSVTRAGLEDYMQGNLKTRVAPDGGPLLSNECIGLADEMNGILPDQDLTHLTLYNRLYDNHSTHKAITRSNGEVRLDAPYCALLTGAQPSFLSLTLPEAAWGMGFMSRAIMVWGVAPTRRSMFEEGTVNWKLQEDLIHDLKEVFNLNGWMHLTASARELYEIWWVEHGGQPIPKHKRLAMGYNGRREINMVKLAMAFSLAESSELIVTEQHIAEAIKTLLEAESQMHYIFQEMNSSGSTMILEDVIDLVRMNTIADKDTNEASIIEILMQKFPPTQVHAHVENLISSGAIANVGNNGARGFRKFRLGKKAGMV